MKCFVIFGFIFSAAYSELLIYSTFHNIGFTKFSSEGRICTVWYQQTGDGGEWKEGLSPTEVAPGKYVGSIFWVSPGKEYEVEVDCGGDVETGFTTTRNEIPQPQVEDAKNLLYVSKTGTGTSCSQTIPCSIETAVENVSPGTHILFEEGIYRVGNLRLDIVSGTANDPIVFRPVTPTTAVTFDGSVRIREFSDIGNNIQRYDYSEVGDETFLVVLVRKSDQKAQRLLRYYNHDQFVGLKYVSPVDDEGIMGYYLDPDLQHLDINLGSGVDITDYKVFLSNKSPFLYISTDYIYLFNLVIRYYGFGEETTMPNALYLRGASHIWIANCTFSHNSRGMYMRLKTEENLIEYNTFIDSKYHFSWDSVKDDTTLQGDYSAEYGGIVVRRSEDASVVAGHGLVIRHNMFTDFFDAFNVNSKNTALPDNPFETPSSDVDIYMNVIRNCRDDGIEVDGLAQNVRVYNNLIENVFAGISMAPAAIGPIFVFQNVIKGIEWTGLKFTYSPIDPPSGYMYIFHNVIWNVVSGSASSIDYYWWELLQFRNNILFGYQLSVKVEFEQDTGPLVDMDYNALAATAEVYNILKWAGKNPELYHTVEDWYTATGMEQHGVIIDDVETVFVTDSYYEVSDSCTALKGTAEFLSGINEQNSDIGLIAKYIVDPEAEVPPIGEKGAHYDEEDDVISEAQRKNIIATTTLLVVLALVLVVVF